MWLIGYMFLGIITILFNIFLLKSNIVFLVIFFVISCKILVLGWKMLKTKNQGSILCILNVDNLNITYCLTMHRERRVVRWCWKTWMPWFFWCYPFEREVIKLVNISSNQLMSESLTLIIMLNYVSQQFTR
jgi:hypothetical protein